jgi:hypothetical protein
VSAHSVTVFVAWQSRGVQPIGALRSKRVHNPQHQQQLLLLQQQQQKQQQRGTPVDSDDPTLSGGASASAPRGFAPIAAAVQAEGDKEEATINSAQQFDGGRKYGSCAPAPPFALPCRWLIGLACVLAQATIMW